MLAALTSLADMPKQSTHQIKLNGHTFTLPVGFRIELIAGPPLVNRPVTADFDEAGHLYVSDSSGSNEPVQVQLAKKPHRILRLTHTNGNGRFDQATVFADQMMFPAGTLWLAGSLYVAAPPSIWKLTDADGDGMAEKREEWFDGKTLTNCANDLHGPYLGPDGWIYWCKGAFAEQRYPQLFKKPKVSRAAHIFRARPDGTGQEPIMVGGMDNPVDVVFTPGGERILSATFLQHPAGGRRDGLIHAIYGGVYGKDHDPIYHHPWTSPKLMPVMTHFGPAAPSGLHRYESDAFGPEYRDNLFCAQFNLRKVSRHMLVPEGSTFRTQDEDFLVSDNYDFHPTDVIEDADGSLLVIDTGGWYKLCCPTSQLVKPDVLGAIYRIRREDARQVDDPRGKHIDWKTQTDNQLIGMLDDSRPTVRRRSIELLAARGDQVVGLLTAVLHSKQDTVLARRNAVWTLCRIANTSARTATRWALIDSDVSVRQAAIHVTSIWRDSGAFSELVAILRSGSSQSRRAAAEAIGRLIDVSPMAYGALFQAIDNVKNDPVLEHSLVYALIELGDRDTIQTWLTQSNPRIRRAAITALENIDNSFLSTTQIEGDLIARDSELRATTTWIAGRHPEWGDQLADVIRQRLSADIDKSERDEINTQLSKLASAKGIQLLLADMLGSNDHEQVRTGLRIINQVRLKRVPEIWLTELTNGLLRDDLIADFVNTARQLKLDAKTPPYLISALMRIGSNEKEKTNVRLNALAAIPTALLEIDDGRFQFLADHVRSDQPVPIRAAAVDVLAHAKLSSDQLIKLAEVLRQCGPMEITTLLPMFGNTSEERVGVALLTALNEPGVRAALHPDALKLALEKQNAKVQAAAERVLTALLADQAEQRAKLERLAGTLRNGDVRRGQTVFNSSKAACASCHAIGYVGGTIGPDLTHIGKLRTERDLLESIVVPSASFVRGYEPVLVVTTAGRQFNGLIRNENPDQIELTSNATEVMRIPRGEIESITPSRISVMPSGLDQQLATHELADLVAFLKACQ